MWKLSALKFEPVTLIGLPQTVTDYDVVGDCRTLIIGKEDLTIFCDKVGERQGMILNTVPGRNPASTHFLLDLPCSSC